MLRQKLQANLLRKATEVSINTISQRLSYELATFCPNKVPAGRHHSSEPKEKDLCQKFRLFFGRIDGKKQKKRKKGLCQICRPFFGRVNGEDQKRKKSESVAKAKKEKKR